MSLPKVMKAYIKDSDTPTASVHHDAPIPRPGPDQLLIKVEYVSQNPADWKAMSFTPVGAIIGTDFSGEIVALGEDLTTPWSVGDRVAGCIAGGAFAEYLVTDSDLVFKIPPEINAAEAATFSMTWWTALQILIGRQQAPWPPAQVPGSPWYLVYGASSSVGVFALQLAKTLGYRIIGVCSPRNFDLVRGYGAEAVFDYADAAETIRGIKELTNGGVTIGLDAISEPSTYAITLNVFRDGEKGVLNVINPPPSVELLQEVPSLQVSFSTMFTLFGHPLDFGPGLQIPAIPADRELARQLNARTSELISNYKIKSSPVEVRDGLEAVTAGLEDMRAGVVSGKKIVCKVA